MACDLEVDAFSSYHFSNAWDEGQGAQQRLHVHVARHIGARTPIERNFADMYSANWKVSAPSAWLYTARVVRVYVVRG